MFLPAGFAAKRQTAGIFIYSQAKNQHFHPAEATAWLHRFTWNLARPRSTWVRPDMQNFTPIGHISARTRPQNGKNFHFLVKSRPARANPLIDFYNIVRGFYTPNYHALAFYIWRESLHELLLRNRASVIYPIFFRAPCAKNCALDRKMIATFLMASTSSITMQSLGRSNNARRLCVNMVFVCLPAGCREAPNCRY